MIDNDLETQLQKALKECASLREENERLKKLLGLHPEDYTPTPKPNISEPSTPYASANQVSNDSPIETRIALFRSLFHGREEVYPVRWEARKGNSGYSPACANEWNRTFCRKPMVKCSDCENRDLRPVTDEVIRGHLLGKHTIGVYKALCRNSHFSCLFKVTAISSEEIHILHGFLSSFTPIAEELAAGHIWGSIWKVANPLKKGSVREFGKSLLPGASKIIIFLNSLDCPFFLFFIFKTFFIVNSCAHFSPLDTL